LNLVSGVSVTDEMMSYRLVLLQVFLSHGMFDYSKMFGGDLRTNHLSFVRESMNWFPIMDRCWCPFSPLKSRSGVLEFSLDPSLLRVRDSDDHGSLVLIIIPQNPLVSSKLCLTVSGHYDVSTLTETRFSVSSDFRVRPEYYLTGPVNSEGFMCGGSCYPDYDSSSMCFSYYTNLKVRIIVMMIFGDTSRADQVFLKLKGIGFQSKVIYEGDTQVLGDLISETNVLSRIGLILKIPRNFCRLGIPCFMVRPVDPIQTGTFLASYRWMGSLCEDS